ncbi:MAG: GHKL domain-containing protein [Lachnospiraceae bacterium]|nr:GHKL domain-containing protein [Lachnospiraceae bacterium]
MISFVLAVAAIVAMALVMGALSRVQEAEMENKWIQEYTESIGELCAGLEEQKDSVRRYYHDLSKHIRTLETMIERQKARECSDREAESAVQTQNADHEETKNMVQAQPDDCKTSQSVTHLEELKQFYEILHEDQREADICADEVINAILSTKTEECRKLQISFHFCAKVPEDLETARAADAAPARTAHPMEFAARRDAPEENKDAGMAFEKPDWISDSDMVAILLNLLDNAIEAQTRIPPGDPSWNCLYRGAGAVEPAAAFAPSGVSGLSGSPGASRPSGMPGAPDLTGLPDASETSVSSGLPGAHESSATSGLSVSVGPRKLCIEVKNKVRSDETISFQTRKPSPSEHGFGLRIIDSVVEKYHGSREVQIDEEQHLFITRVIISGESLRSGISLRPSGIMGARFPLSCLAAPAIL